VRKYERIKDGPDPLDVDLAEATLDHAQLNLNKAQANLDGLTIAAPFDGQVLSMSLSPGMQVTAFKPVMTVVDPAGLEITLPHDLQLAEISVGQEAIMCPGFLVRSSPVWLAICLCLKPAPLSRGATSPSAFHLWGRMQN
jgi:hypothetical protein